MALKAKFSVIDIIIYLFLIFCALMVIIPMWNILVISTSTKEVFMLDKYHLIPRSFSLAQYERALSSIGGIMRAFLISAQVTVFGTLLSMLLTSLGAYVMSKSKMPGRDFLFKILIFTMFFGGGLMPFYVLVRNLGLIDTLFSMFLPTAISTYNLILLKNYFATIPESFEEAARIDGYNDMQILFKIIIPLSKPAFAAIALFYAVAYWNDYFMATLFISSNDMFPLQVVLRQMIILNMVIAQVGSKLKDASYEQFKMACIIIGMLPILCVYPFIQKYFSKGIMLGAIKE